MQKLIIFILTILITTSDMYVISKLSGTKISIKKYLIWGSIVVVILYFNTIYNNLLFKPILVLGSFFLIKYFALSGNVSSSIICSFYTQILSIISEAIICTIVFTCFKNIDMNTWSQTNVGIIVCNLSTILLMIMLVSVPIVKKIYLKLEQLVQNIGKYKLVLFIITMFILITILFNVIYFKYGENHLLLYFVVLIIFAFYTFIIFMILYFNGRYNKVASKYSLSLENLSEYEEIINKYRVLNHENKNNLLIIRNMGNYSKAKKYIDQLIENKEQENKQIFNIVKRIPSPYLRAVVYTKMNKMKNNNINSQLVVGRNISSKLFLNLDSSLILDVCNIVNVFLDNAIDASILSDKKNVLIDISKDKDLNITISNTFDGEVQLNQINNMGYTSKGKGHGYGLALVKDIINKNKNLENITEFENGIFTQILIIKLN